MDDTWQLLQPPSSSPVCLRQDLYDMPYHTVCQSDWYVLLCLMKVTLNMHKQCPRIHMLSDRVGLRPRATYVVTASSVSWGISVKVVCLAKFLCCLVCTQICDNHTNPTRRPSWQNLPADKPCRPGTGITCRTYWDCCATSLECSGFHSA